MSVFRSTDHTVRKGVLKLPAMMSKTCERLIQMYPNPNNIKNIYSFYLSHGPAPSNNHYNIKTGG